MELVTIAVVLSGGYCIKQQKFSVHSCNEKGKHATCEACMVVAIGLAGLMNVSLSV